MKTDIDLSGAEIDKVFFIVYEILDSLTKSSRKHQLRQARMLRIVKRLYMAVSQWSINKSVPVTFYKEDILELRKYIPWAYDPYRSLDWRSIEDKLDKAIDEFEADE